jgi:phosphoketolase
MPDTQLVTNSTGPLSSKQLRGLDAYWRAANYLSVGQVYLLDNPLLREPLAIEHVMHAAVHTLVPTAREDVEIARQVRELLRG